MDQESKKLNKCLDLAREQKKKIVVEHQGDSDDNHSWSSWNNPVKEGIKTMGSGNVRND